MQTDPLILRYGNVFRFGFWFGLGGSALFSILFAAIALFALPAAPGQRVALGLLFISSVAGGVYCVRDRHHLEETFTVREATLIRTDAAGRVFILPFDQIGAVRRNLFAGYFTIVSLDGAIRWRIYYDLPFSENLCQLAQRQSNRST